MTAPQTRETSLTWYAGACDTGDELGVAHRLRQKGAIVACPTYRERTRPAGKRKPMASTRIVAAYPGYVFLSRGTVMDLEAVCLKVKGFHYIVSFSQCYSECRDEDLQRAMAYVRELEERGVFMPTTVDGLVRRKLLGALVKVEQHHLFSGYRGIVERLKGAEARLKGGDFNIPTWIPADRLVIEQLA